MDWTAVLDYVENNLATPLSLDGLARRTGMSPFHFHRRFHAEVGEAPMQYVRRLRLEAAAVRLKHSERRVTDVAFAAGYETHEGFTRAFRAQFGVSPQRFRAAHGAGDLPSGFSPRLVTLPSQRIAFLRHVGPYDRSPDTFARLAAWAAAHGRLGGEMLALYYDDQDVTSPGRTRCDVAVAVAADVESDGEVRVRELPGRPYAVIPQAGEVAERRHFYDVAFRVWLPSIGRRAAAAPPFEAYRVVGGFADLSATEIHIPLRPR